MAFGEEIKKTLLVRNSYLHHWPLLTFRYHMSHAKQRQRTSPIGSEQDFGVNFGLLMQRLAPTSFIVDLIFPTDSLAGGTPTPPPL